MAPRRTSAFEVPPSEKKSDEELLRQLYAPPVEMQTFRQQMSDAITIQSMKGVWSFRESFAGRPATAGVLTFRGADFAERGVVTYTGEAASGRGPWVIKADGFGRSPSGKVGGAIERKALWKLRRGSGGTFTFAGRVNVASYRAPDGLPDAKITGNIVELIAGGKPKGGSEKVVTAAYLTVGAIGGK